MRLFRRKPVDLPARVLVLDDEEPDRAHLVRELEAAGHRVVDSSRVQHAAALADVHRDVEVVVLVHRDSTPAPDLVGRLRDYLDPPMVIVVAEKMTQEDSRALLKVGTFDALPLPLDFADLLRSIHDALQRRKRDAATAEVLARVSESDRLHRFLVEQSPDVIYMLDIEGRFSFVSASAEEVFGKRPDELVGTDWRDLFAPGEQERASKRFDERRTHDRATRNLELRLASSEMDRPRWVEISATGLYRGGEPGSDTTERYDGTYGIARDVSAQHEQTEQRAQLEAQLERARRTEAVGQLAGGIAHDFNNILASMIGYAELAQVSLDPDTHPEQIGYLTEVVSAGQRARDLIAQLLNFSRPDRGTPSAVLLDQEMSAVLRMLRAVIPTSIQIEHVTGHADAAVNIDPIQLQQIVLNLVINARDALGESGRITLAITSGRLADTTCTACSEPFGGERVTLEVSDNGPGIPAEIQRKLFDPLVTTRAGQRGTGFGLSLVETIVHRHGGHLEVHSTPGDGTRFRIHFPVGEPVAGEVAEAATMDPSAADGGAHITVVDDEASVANFLRQLLEHAGYRTTVFNDPETAFDFIRQNVADINLVITDQTMPRFTGTELARRVNELAAPPPVILCTGYGHESAANESHLLAAVLAKPFQIRDLLSEVSRHIRAA